jgi:hypothetical protein
LQISEPTDLFHLGARLHMKAENCRLYAMNDR